MKKSITFLIFLLGFNISCTSRVSSISNETKQIILSEVNQTTIPQALVNQLIIDINNNDNKFTLNEEDLKILNKNLKSKQADLNADGIREFILYIDHHDWCGAGSNCTHWIYQANGNKYKLILETAVLGIKDTYTNGYKDLLSEHKMGICKSENGKPAFNLLIIPFKFDGEKYVEGKDYNECRKFLNHY